VAAAQATRQLAVLGQAVALAVAAMEPLQSRLELLTQAVVVVQEKVAAHRLVQAVAQVW
jgi:hypothetical protein